MNLKDILFPIIVPRSYFQYGNWPGPYRLLAHPKLGLTWVLLDVDDNSQAMLYLNHEDAEKLVAAGVNYEERAMENLRQHSSEWAGTHTKKVDGALHFIAMMQPDGLGTSRLLLADRIASVFPEGYHLAIPERSCGIAVSKQLAGEDLAVVLKMIHGCWDKGTTPMLDGLHAAEDFKVSSGLM
jgi:hypothetical protein